MNLVGTFAFYDYKEGDIKGRLPDQFTQAKDWKPGMFRASSSDFAATEEMVKVDGTDYWTITLPLPSGHYLYNYNIDDTEENTPDPANPPMASTAQSGSTSRLSTLNVPYDEKQGDSIDFSSIMPRADNKTGKIEFADYTDVQGNTAPLAIYLPYGYDPEKEGGYKTLYLGHGGGGNELEWFASGNTHCLFDNLIAEETIEPTIVVTMNNGVYDWDFSIITDNIMNKILPYMEENYNVSKEISGRAFAGLSMGSLTTLNVYYDNADQFGYFGMFSAFDLGVDLTALDIEKLKTPKIMMGAGIYDMAYVTKETTKDPELTVETFKDKFTNAGIEYTFTEVKGGHDWTTWPQLLKIFVEDYLWK